MPKSGARRRRSVRVPLKIPVTVSGVDSSGFKFQSSAETVSVSKYGARVRTGQRPQQMSCGGEVQVTLPRAGQSRAGRVVWLRGEEEYGLELENPSSFWGVAFPPRDGEEPAVENKPAKPAAVLEPARPHLERPQPAPTVPARPAPPPPSAPAKAEAPVKPGQMVLVTGISSTRSAFQERTALTGIEADEGSVSLREPVDIGTALRVLIGDRPVKAWVMALLKNGQPNRSLVRLKFAEELAGKRA